MVQRIASNIRRLRIRVFDFFHRPGMPVNGDAEKRIAGLFKKNGKKDRHGR
jgi:hypothetical protein